MKFGSRGALRGFAFAALACAGVGVVPAQMGNAVRYTEAREIPVRRTIRLPGSVEASQLSMVASEVSGKVQSFLAREGTVIRKGEPLVGLDTDQLGLARDAAVAQLKESEARLELAERTLARSEDLFRKEILPQQDLDNAVSEFHAWQGRVVQSTARLASIELDMERSTIRAPFSGTVVEEHCEIGEWVERGSPVVSVLSLENLEVRVDVPERFFRNLDRDVHPTVTFEALPGLEVSGEIRAIIPRADILARTFPVKIGIPNAEGRIGVGMVASVTLPAGESFQATVVPKDAVITQGDMRFVYLIDGENLVQMTPVSAGEGVGAWIVVRGEVAPGQKVVTRGNERLMPGQEVQGEPQEYALP